jgi:Leucine-rich repeat (LRR) protein
MKKLYFLFFLTIGFLGNAQIVNIPDSNFKAMLLSANPSNFIASTELPTYLSSNDSWTVSNYHVIDTNGDGEIQVIEAQSIKYLTIAGDTTISDLTGIQAFINLHSLIFESNQLTSLNVSGLTNLEWLRCQSNYQLTNLNVFGCLNLKKLECGSNQLYSLDISGLSNLLYLSCSLNQINSLDVTSAINLKTLLCTYNNLTSLNVSGLTNLNLIDCQNNQLVNLGLSNNVSLQYFACTSNQLTNLDVSGLTNLQFLGCSNNQLLSLDVSGLTNLTEISCNNNLLPIIDFSGLSNLNKLSCKNNQLTSIDVSGLNNLSWLRCDNNQLETLLIKNTNLNWSFSGFYNNPTIEYVCADFEDFDIVQQQINNYGYNTTCHVNSYCSFTPGGTYYEISGNTKFDSNSNGCDISDLNYSNLNFSITDGTYSSSLISNSSGNYYIPVSAGNYTITPNLENPSYFNISPTNFTVDFPSQVSPFNQDFCVTANGVYSDVEIVLVPTTPARPGFDATYKLVYRNKGNQVENGTISLTFDDARLDYVAANPVYDSSVLNNFTWNYTNLQPFETREIEIVFNVNSPMETPAVNIGDQIDFLAQITPFTNDEVQSDNISALKQTVVGSYDPNDKTCLQGETIPLSEVGKYVHYIIRFENTGTFPAENIVVKDLIDLAKFDIATLIPLNSSHDFYTRINGNKVEFIFENINLDFNDATNDGYVAFKIKTKPTLVVGNTFSNNANIYFDYNFPITTNTYTTTVAALSTQDFDFGTYFTLYPNPANDVLNIQTKQDLQVNSIEIYNQLGQIVLAVTNTVNSIDVTDLASGTYFLKVNTEKGSANSKFVKE